MLLVICLLVSRPRSGSVLCTLGAILLGVPAIGAGPPDPPGPGVAVTPADPAVTDRSVGTAPAAAPANRRLREGTRIVDSLGRFKMTGDQATFYTLDGKYRLVGLPNLNLERIVRTLRDNPDPLVWSASGTITEYQGSNYLLITRAILKAKKQSPPLIGLGSASRKGAPP